MADERIEIDIVANAENIDAINSVANGLQNLSGVVSSVGSSLADGTSSLRGYVNGFIDLNNDINNASRRVRASLSGFHNMWVGGLRTAVREIKSLTKEAIDSYTQLTEQHAKTTGAMQNNYNLKTTTGQRQYAQDSEELKQQAIRQSRTGPTGKGSLYTVVDVSAAQTALVKAGVKPENILKTDVLNTILKFAQANEVSTDDAVTFATALGNQFNVPYDEWGDMLDKISHAADLSPINVSDIVMSMRYAGGITSGLGRSIDEILAMVAMMGQFGLKGSQAGTASQSLYTRLLTGDTTVITEAQAEVAPPKALKAFYDFSMFAKSDGSGLTYEQIQNADTYEKLGEISGNLRPMEEVVDQLDEVLSTMNDQEQAWFIKKFFGLYQMKGAYALINGDGDNGTGEGSIKDYEEEIRDNSKGTNDAKFNQLIESDYGKQTALDVALDSTKTDIGSRLSPLVNEIREQLYEYLNDPNHYQIDFDGIRDALEECSDLIAEQYGDAIGEVMNKITGGIIDLTEIGIEFAPEFADGIMNIINAFAEFDIKGVIDAWNGMIDDLGLSVGDLPEDLQELGDKIVGVTKAFGILMGLDIGSRILETLTNALKVIQILGGAVINASSVVIQGEFPGGVANPLNPNGGGGGGTGGTGTGTGGSSTKKNKKQETTSTSTSSTSNAKSDVASTAASAAGSAAASAAASKGSKKQKKTETKTETKTEEPVNDPIEEKILKSEQSQTPAVVPPTKEEQPKSSMSDEHKTHIKADADKVFNSEEYNNLPIYIPDDLTEEQIKNRLIELNKIPDTDPNYPRVYAEKDELYKRLGLSGAVKPVYSNSGEGDLNKNTGTKIDPNINKIKDYIQAGDNGILTDQQLSNMTIDEIDARIAELNKVKPGSVGIKTMDFTGTREIYDPSYYDPKDPANAQFELAKQEKNELYSLKQYRNKFGNPTPVTQPVVEEPKTETPKTGKVEEVTPKGTKGLVEGQGNTTHNIGEGNNKSQQQIEKETRDKLKAPVDKEGVSTPVEDGLEDRIEEAKNKNKKARNKNENSSEGTTTPVPTTKTNATDSTQVQQAQPQTKFNLFNDWKPNSKGGLALYNGAMFIAGMSGMITGSQFGSQIGDWLEQKITGKDGWFGDSLGGLAGGMAGYKATQFAFTKLASAVHNLGVGAKGLISANLGGSSIGAASGLATGLSTLASVAPYLVVVSASTKTGFDLYKQKKNREELYETREDGGTPAFDNNGDIMRDSDGNIVTYEQLSEWTKQISAERAAREDKYQYNNGQITQMLREAEPDNVNWLKPSTWGNGKKKKQWREDNAAAEKQVKQDEENFYTAQQQLYYDSGILLQYKDFQNNYEGFTNYVDELNKSGAANLADFEIDQSVIDKFTVASEQWAIAFIDQVNEGIENTNKYKQEEINKIDPNAPVDSIMLRNTPDINVIPNTEENRNQILDGVLTAENPNEQLAANISDFLNKNLANGDNTDPTSIFTRLDSLNTLVSDISSGLAQIIGGDRNDTEKSTLNDKVDSAVERLNEVTGKYNTLEDKVAALSKDGSTQNQLMNGVYAHKDPEAAMEVNLRDLLVKGQVQGDNTLQNQLESLNATAGEISGKMNQEEENNNAATKEDVQNATQSVLSMTIPDILANLTKKPETQETIDNKIEQTIQMVDQSTLTITPQTTPVSVSPNITVQVNVDSQGNVTMTKSQQNTLFNMITNYNVSKSRSYNNNTTTK